jgi:hypothetical protein
MLHGCRQKTAKQRLSGLRPFWANGFTNPCTNPRTNPCLRNHGDAEAQATLKPKPARPIHKAMNGLLHWLLTGTASLVFMAIVVAWWEHLGRAAAQHDARQPLPRNAATVDVELDALAAAPLGSGDVYERQQTLGGAMARMAGATGTAWTDTAPMIGMGSPERKLGGQRRPQQIEPVL